MLYMFQDQRTFHCLLFFSISITTLVRRPTFLTINDSTSWHRLPSRGQRHGRNLASTRHVTSPDDSRPGCWSGNSDNPARRRHQTQTPPLGEAQPKGRYAAHALLDACRTCTYLALWLLTHGLHHRLSLNVVHASQGGGAIIIFM